MKEVLEEGWYLALNEDLQSLVGLSIELYEREAAMGYELPDYCYLVFPMAKAFEGFLKQYFRSLGLLSEKAYESKRFRVGRAMNPDINPNHRDEYWMFDDVTKMCGRDVAMDIWQTWLECRNQIFHYFPGKNIRCSLSEAESHLKRLTETMKSVFECKIRA